MKLLNTVNIIIIYHSISEWTGAQLVACLLQVICRQLKKYCSKHSGKKANSISLGHRGKNASYTQHGKAPRMRVSLWVISVMSVLQNLCQSWYAFAASFIGDIAEGFCEGHLPFASLGWGCMKDLSGKWHFFPLVILSNLWVKHAKSKIKIDVITLQRFAKCTHRGGGITSGTPGFPQNTCWKMKPYVPIFHTERFKAAMQ